MTTSATYAPGSWVAIAARDYWLLVEIAPDHELVGRCWSLLSTGAGIDDVLDALVGGGIRTAPSFALARASAEEHRAVVRGDARVVLADGRELVAPAGRTWADDAIPDGVPFSLFSSNPTGGHPLPMAAGVTMASSITVYVETDTAQPPVDEPPARPPAPAPEPAHATEPGHEMPADSSEPTAPEPSEPEPSHPERSDPEPSEPEPSDPVSSEAERQARQASYDFLFEATQRPGDAPPLPAPLQPITAEPPAAEPPQADTARPAPADAPPVTVSPTDTASWMTQSGFPNDEPAANPAGLIDALPWAQPSASSRPPIDLTVDVPAPAVAQAAVTPATVAPADDVPEVDRTIDRATLGKLLGNGPAAPISGPTVLAGHCPSRHLSPPNAAVCRVCGQAMPAQEGFEIARPALGVLKLSTGDTVVLDRPVVLGRSPEIPQDAAERPNAVRLASPENDISRTHAEVMLDGWYVYVTDMGSTNGTVVTLQGQPPRRLRAHDPQLLEHGAHVNLADEVSFVYEVTG